MASYYCITYIVTTSLVGADDHSQIIASLNVWPRHVGKVTMLSPTASCTQTTEYRVYHPATQLVIRTRALIEEMDVFNEVSYNTNFDEPTMHRSPFPVRSSALTDRVVGRFHPVQIVETNLTNYHTQACSHDINFDNPTMHHCFLLKAAARWFIGLSGDFIQSFFRICLSCDSRKFGFSAFSRGKLTSSNAVNVKYLYY